MNDINAINLFRKHDRKKIQVMIEILKFLKIEFNNFNQLKKKFRTLNKTIKIFF